MWAFTGYPIRVSGLTIKSRDPKKLERFSLERAGVSCHSGFKAVMVLANYFC